MQPNALFTHNKGYTFSLMQFLCWNTTTLTSYAEKQTRIQEDGQ